jgi:hypothetical protein
LAATQDRSGKRKTKTRHWAGFGRKKMERDGYPAGCGIAGRRAREVMPAAMRALVRTKILPLQTII